tara:strand:+ start:14495 stop:15013 length:519 start_codon:yes stop_codon:yes gene_type:complete
MPTKIISGRFKGFPVNTGNYKDLRPTSSRVRSSMFDILGDLHGKDILDLFAGAGTLGLEALSRGAESVTFVEKKPRTANLMKKYYNRFDNHQIKVVIKDAFKFLKNCGKSYDVIIADPPYEKVDLLILKELSLKCLNKNGKLVIEMQKKEAVNFTTAKIKTYGDTSVAFFGG